MGRFDRFKKLERARPDAPDAPEAQASSRFGKIEARREPAPKAAPDPFAPPPDDADAAIELADEDDRVHVRAKAEKAAWAKAQIDAEAQRIAELRMRQEAEQDSIGLALARGPGALVKLTSTQRMYILGGSLVAIAILATVVSKILWGLAPIAICLWVASEFVAKNQRP